MIDDGDMKTRRQVVITVNVNGQVQWQVTKDDRSGRFIGVCPPLGLTIEAESHRELMENISDSLHLLMMTMLQQGELDRFLRDRGWTAKTQDIKNASSVFFDVPIELITQRSQNDFARKVH